MTFISSFSKPFMMSVLFGIVASVVLTLPILAVLYHRRNRLQIGTILSVYLSILYVFALAFFTLYPLPSNPAQYCATHHVYPQLNWLGFIDDLRSAGKRAVLQIGLNVLFFVPLGFILKRLFRWRWYAIIPMGFAVSLLIETSQGTGLFGLFPCAYRVFDVDDLLSNTSGAVIGLWLASMWNRVDPPEEANTETVTRPGLIRRFVAFVVDYVLIVAASFLVSIPLALLVGSTTVNQTMANIVTFVMFIVAEGVIPWFSRGQTLAGRFVHMTCETKYRERGPRALFYVIRLVVLYCAVFLQHNGWNLILVLVLLVFWLIKRCMPYDLVPGEEWSQEAPQQ